MKRTFEIAVINLLGFSTRIVLHKEGGFHCESLGPGGSWYLDNDSVSDQECVVILDSLARAAAYASKNA